MRVLILLLLAPCIAFSQQSKTVDKSFKIPSSKEVKMNLKFAGNIKITPTNAKQVTLKTTFTYSDEKFLERYDEEISEGSILEIETGLKKSKEDNKKRYYECWSCEDSDCFCLAFDYEILVPSSVKLNLETISGDIDVGEWSGALRAKSISGYIDIVLRPNAKRDINLKSVTGEVYTDLDKIRLDKGSTSYSKKMSTSLNGGGNLASLQTVSGDIYIRKTKYAN